MNKEIETINKTQEEMNNKILQIKNTLEANTSRLDEAQVQISKLEDKVEKTPRKSKKRKLDKEGRKRC